MLIPFQRPIPIATSVPMITTGTAIEATLLLSDFFVVEVGFAVVVFVVVGVGLLVVVLVAVSYTHLTLPTKA